MPRANSRGIKKQAKFARAQGCCSLTSGRQREGAARRGSQFWPGWAFVEPSTCALCTGAPTSLRRRHVFRAYPIRREFGMKLRSAYASFLAPVVVRNGNNPALKSRR